MSRLGALVGVVALLLGGLSGCTLDSANLNVFAASNEREQVISGSLTSVVAATHDSLVKFNVKVNETKDGDTICLASTTPAGKKFTLRFDRVQGPNGEQTRMSIDWYVDADVDFWFQLVEIVANAQIQANQTSK